ncbi:hypothetical protein EGW03_02705 [bacterium]|nr:hypothetical protein [bacterium]
MTNNHLKLYNSSLTIRLKGKEKSILRKNAYRNNLTISEYIRLLIMIDNRINSIQTNNKKNNKSLEEISLAKLRIGRDSK